MQFADEVAAGQFQQSLSGWAIGLANLLALAPNDSPKKLDQESLRTLMTLLLLDKRGASLSKTIDLGMLERFGEISSRLKQQEPAGQNQAGDDAGATTPKTR